FFFFFFFFFFSFFFVFFVLFFFFFFFFFFQAEDGIRDATVTGVQTCALPISSGRHGRHPQRLDRRLRAGEKAQRPWPDLDRIDQARMQRPRLPGNGGHPPHGLAHRVCAVALFAASARGNRLWSDHHLSCPCGARRLH